MKLDFSFIIPVYNRPQEIQELLESFMKVKSPHPFEIVIVEDGSTESSESVIAAYSDKLEISYYQKPNSGPGDSRNFGMRKAKGNYFIILDSDVLMPEDYLQTVSEFLQKDFYHCFGGADAAHESFSNLQKAINYVMTSFFTTGGIRGSKSVGNTFEPRSFNMGISKEAFEATGGFGTIHPGEDPDLSQRIKKSGYKTTFIPGAAVYHKRRISWSKFYTQVKKFGLVRPILTSWHPNTAKLTFWFPSLFILFVLTSIVATAIVHWGLILPLCCYLLLIFIESAIRNRSILIAILSVMAVFVQFFGYGWAFFRSTILIRLLKKDPQQTFPKLFFK